MASVRPLPPAPPARPSGEGTDAPHHPASSIADDDDDDDDDYDYERQPGGTNRAAPAAAGTVPKGPPNATDLRALAKIDLNPRFTIKSYVGAVSALLHRAKNSDNLGEIDTAFVSYLKVAAIANFIPKHPDFASEKQAHSGGYERYLSLTKYVPQLIDRTRRIEEQLIARSLRQARHQSPLLAQRSPHQVASSSHQTSSVSSISTPRDTPLPATTSSSSSSAKEDVQPVDLVARLNALRTPAIKPLVAGNALGTAGTTHYPSIAELESSSTKLPSVPHTAPGIGPKGAVPAPPPRLGTTSPNPAPVENGSTIPTAPRFSRHQLASSSLSNVARPGSELGSELSPVSTGSGSGSGSAWPAAPLGPKKKPPPPPPPKKLVPVLSPLPGSGDGTYGELPPSPQTTVVRYDELWKLLNPGFYQDASTSKMEKRKGFKVLLLDVRPREAFNRAHILAKYTACIDPVTLRPDMRGKEIEERLFLAPTEEQAHFAHRNEFDLVVLYDQAWRRSPNNSLAGPSPDDPLAIVNRAIYELEFEKPLRRQPILLSGGFSKWEQGIGSAGVASLKAREVGITNGTRTDYPPVAGTRPSTYQRPTPPPQDFKTPSLPRPLPPPAAAAAARPSVSLEYPTLRTASSYAPSPAPVVSPPQISHTPSASVPTISSSHGPAPPIPASPFRAQHTGPPPSKPTPPPLPPSHPVGPTQATTSAAATNATAPSHAGPVVRRESMRIGMTGLRNVANTCYMNSVVQCLSATPELAQFFVRGDYTKMVNHSNPLGTSGKLADAFATLLKTLWSQTYEYIKPVGFRQVLTKTLPTFSGNEQHDCHEFLSFLTDTLHEDLNQPTKHIVRRPGMTEEQQRQVEEAELERIPISQGAEREWIRYAETNNSFLLKVFAGMLRNRMQCSTCGTTSTTYNVFRDLSLPIPAPQARKTTSIYDALSAFLAPETLDGDDRWVCSKCKVARRAIKQLTLARLPPYLVIHLKRFSFTLRGSWGSSKEGKVDTRVEFPLDGLDLSRFCPGGGLYDLYGVVHHFGTLNSGHYTATIRNEGRWDYVDDSRIVRGDDQQLYTNSPYVLWYQRRAS